MSDSTDGGDEPTPGSAGSGPLPPHLDPRGGRALPPRPPRVRPGTTAPAASAVVPPAPPRRRTARILSWVAAITAVVILCIAAGGYALVNHYEGNITRVDVFGANDKRPAATSKGAKNILIVGSDSRGDLAPGEGTQGKGAEFVTGQRSDTVILAHLYGNSEIAQLVSFPRDSWVTIPEHTGPDGTVVPAREDKLNAAFFEGGPPLLIRTIERLSGLYVNHYMQIDFDGFQRMVDTLGGVEVCLSQPAKEKDSGIDLKAGRQVIQGEQALAFVRQRKELPRGDLDRIERQKQFIGAIVRKTKSAGTLLNPFKVNELLKVATDSLVLDEQMSVSDLRGLALRARNFDNEGVIFTTVPIAQLDGRRKGQDVILLDEPKMQVLFGELKRDVPPTPPPPPPPPDAPLTVPPAAVQVKVFNGAGTPGLGRTAYDDLDKAGFRMSGTPGNRGPAGAGTVVLHGRDQVEAARTLVASLPGATAQLNPALTGTLEVVVGSSYTGVTPVQVAAPAAPAPSGPAAPVEAPTTAAEDPCGI